jgi:hypothetical protein
MKRLSAFFVLLLASATLNCFAADDQGFVDTFDVKPDQFSSTGKNDYFVLEPGTKDTFEGQEEGKPAKLVISVLDETRRIDGVKTRVIEERETHDGSLVEVSRNYFAIDRSTGDVYYFGEDVDVYEDGKLTSHPGSWHAGENGAHFGLFMPAKPTRAQKFYQEVAPKVAMDRCEVVAANETAKVPAGEFQDCIKMEETTPLEPATKEYKLYAKGVGLLMDGDLKLVKHEAPDKKAEKPEADKSANSLVPIDVAREALGYVGADPQAEGVWMLAINDPSLSANQRQDLIEDLNEQGFADPENVTPDELPLVMGRMALIEQLAPDAMDDVNAAAFEEAYKDLFNIAHRLGVE